MRKLIVKFLIKFENPLFKITRVNSILITKSINLQFFTSNIQVKRYESDRILGLSVIINGSTILFIDVYFAVTCHEKYEEYIMCLGILSSILESHEEDHVCMHTGRL